MRLVGPSDSLTIGFDVAKADGVTAQRSSRSHAPAQTARSYCSSETRPYISTRVPSSTTRADGMRK